MTEREWLCHFCQKPTEQGSNYCSFDCVIALARANGAVEHLPNGLPIRCITNGLLIECEHGDHPDYKFPVQIDGENSPEDIAIGYQRYPEAHALIYTDGFVALTMYECCYATWHVRTGEWLGGSLWDKTNSLSEASRAKIIAWLEKGGAK